MKSKVQLIVLWCLVAPMLLFEFPFLPFYKTQKRSAHFLNGETRTS